MTGAGPGGTPGADPGRVPAADPGPDGVAGADREAGTEGPEVRTPAERARRHLVTAVVVAAAGAGLALWAAGHGWAVRVAVRPAPLPPLRVTRTGGAVLPWLPALGWVALAGAGAVLATRRLGRALVGAVLVVAGLGLLAAGGYGLSLPGVRVAWPLLAVLGGVLVAGAGVATVRWGSGWPAMGTRYERAAAPRTGGPASESEIWSALDRGEDPTARD